MRLFPDLFAATASHGRKISRRLFVRCARWRRHLSRGEPTGADDARVYNSAITSIVLADKLASTGRGAPTHRLERMRCSCAPPRG